MSTGVRRSGILNVKIEFFRDSFACELYGNQYNAQTKNFIFVLITFSMTQSAKNPGRKPVVSKNCIGCGACAAISGEVFKMSETTFLSEVLPLDSYEGKDVDDAMTACPVGAIVWGSQE